MNPIRIIAFLATASLLEPFSLGEIANTHLNLTVSHSDLKHSLEFSTGGTDSATPSMQTRHMNAWVEWDTKTLQANSVRFHTTTIVVYGGLQWDDYELDVNTRLDPPGTPAFDSTWKYSTKGLKAYIAPNDKKIPILNESGEFDAQLYVYRGSATVEFSGNGNNVSQTVANSLTIPFSKPARIRIERLPDTLMEGGFAFHFDFEFFKKEVEESLELGTTSTTIDQGRFTLTGTEVTPTKFARWTQHAGSEYTSLERGTISPKGVPIELAYALDLNMRYVIPDRSPISFSLVGGLPTLRLRSNHLNEDIFVEYSTDLNSDNWIHVPDTWIDHGTQSLKRGSDSPISISIPPSRGTTFLRIRPDF